MSKVKFYPRSKKGSSKIQVRISISRKQLFHLTTSKSIQDVETQWDFNKALPIEPKKAKVLQHLKLKIEDYLSDAEYGRADKALSRVTSDDIKKIIYDFNDIPEADRNFTKSASKSLSLYIDRFISRCRKKGYRTKDNKLKSYSEGTLSKYSQLKTSIDLFSQEEGIKVNINSFDSKLIDRYESFITEQYAVSTAGRKLKTLKTVLKTAYEKDKENVHPDFRSIKGYTYETTVVPLTEAEQELIYATPMPSDLMEYAKDWLLVFCGTGQRFSDVIRMDKSMIQDNVLTITQKKTGATVEIPLFDRVKRVIEKYDGFPPKLSENESSQNTHLNKMFKLVCAECQINEELNEYKNGKLGKYPKYDLITTKTGRKSLATYLYRELKWEVQSCMAITGHVSPQNFFIYVGGKDNPLNEINRQRIEEINKKTVENRSSKLKIS